MADVIDAASKFRPMPPLRDITDPGLQAIATLPLQAGLGTRVRTMIEAGSTDEVIDLYIASWICSARADVDANRDLHFQIAAHLRGFS